MPTQPTRLRLERWRRGLTLLDMQIRTGVPATKLSLAERSLARLSPAESAAVAGVLEIADADLDAGQPSPDGAKSE